MTGKTKSSVGDQLLHLISKFNDRTLYFKNNVLPRPLTPTDEDIQNLDEEVDQKLKENANYLDTILETEKTKNWVSVQKAPLTSRFLWMPLDPQSDLSTFFVMVQCLCFGYNAWTIPLRVSFHIYQTPNNRSIWMVGDYICDLLYIIDTLLVQTRIMFLNEEGMYCRDRKLMILHYIKSANFKYDLASLIPLDVFYTILGFRGQSTIIRLPRFLRYRNFNLFFQRLDATLAFPLIVRLARTLNIMLYLIHLNSCSYYAYSDIVGIGSNSFVYDGEGFAYIRCFYVGLKCAISIGKNPKPNRNDPLEMVFMGSSWLVGVFVFAVLIGNVKDIISQSTRDSDAYKFSFDRISQYMHRLKVRKTTINRVKQWCEYTWRTQKSFNESEILEFLPQKLRAEIAIDVHFKTMKKVKLFEGCDPRLLYDLVLKLRPMIFLSGDYICKKGDIGKEMFIITTGQVQVVGGPNDSNVYVTLGEGVCFGEIALLGTGGMNRRTANVRAHGFTTLYALFKEDLQECLTDYQEDKTLLLKKAAKAAKDIASKNAEAEKDLDKQKEVIIIPLELHRMAKVAESLMERRRIGRRVHKVFKTVKRLNLMRPK